MIRFTITLCLLALLACVPAGAAQDNDARGKDESNFKYNTVTTPEGLVFRVPEDMPIEKRGGILAPIPFDEYTYGKFKQLDTRLAAIDARLERIEALIASLKADDTKPLHSS